MAYTGNGDNGYSKIMGTNKIKYKTDKSLVASGDLEELNAELGIVVSLCKINEHEDIVIDLVPIQKLLFRIIVYLQTDDHDYCPAIEPEIALTELMIDRYFGQINKDTTLVIPSGGRTSCHLHLARAICRRAERDIIPLYNKKLTTVYLYKYINRLSSLLYVMARYCALKDGINEINVKD